MLAVDTLLTEIVRIGHQAVPIEALRELSHSLVSSEMTACRVAGKSFEKRPTTTMSDHNLTACLRLTNQNSVTKLELPGLRLHFAKLL